MLVKVSELRQLHLIFKEYGVPFYVTFSQPSPTTKLLRSTMVT